MEEESKIILQLFAESGNDDGQDELTETDKAFDAMVADYEAKLADKDKQLNEANKMIGSLSKALRERGLDQKKDDEEEKEPTIEDSWGEILGTEGK